jgi:serine/threonine protein kinase/Flp pilus assembly protein TadD
MTFDPPDGDATRSMPHFPRESPPRQGDASRIPFRAGQLKPGDVLGDRFVIIQFLARGGMGEVYEAADRHLQLKHCALKTVRPEIAEDEAVRARFEREVLLAREVTHPNVCTTYDLFRLESNGAPILFLTMRLVRGESLAARLNRAGSLDLEAAEPLIRQMAAALDAAHRAGVIHRDFKPGNVMLEGAGPDVRVSVTDFGLSRAYDADSTLAETGRISGTLGYIAPEILHGRTASPASDVYAFGVVMYEMLTGKKPGGNAGRASVARPANLAPDLPRAWDRVILGCLEEDPAKRFQSAAEALSALESRSQSATSPGVRAPRRRRWLLGIAALVVVLFCGAWLSWSAIYRILHPLPEKRFVALMVWPAESNPANHALLNAVLDRIGRRLARAEASMKNLLIISSSDLAGQATPKTPGEATDALGANLVLAESLRPSSSGITLKLTVLDSKTNRELRQDRVFAETSELNRLPERASVSAAKLLDVEVIPGPLSDRDELANVSPAAYQLFNSAEDLAKQPNDTGLDQGIVKYQQALETDSRFALGYARLSMAYLRKFNKTQDQAVLNLAARNADLALRYNPDSAKALLSRALVDVNSGNQQHAIDELGQALKLDPANPQILLYKARALRDLGRRDEEEALYRGILRERPNYWPAYNELGWTLYRHGDYVKAAEAFGEGTAVAPQVALLLTNLGAMYLLLDRKREAEDAFRRSLERAPNEIAYMNLGSIAFGTGDYRKAIDYYSKARDLRPKNDKAWRNLGDCYAQLGDQARVTENYARAAELLSEVLHGNPRRGSDWMDLAFYEAKLGKRLEAESYLKNAESRGAAELYSQFKKAQVLALLGRKQEALGLVLECIDKGLSKVEVDLALDLKEVRADPRYTGHVAPSKAKP